MSRLQSSGRVAVTGTLVAGLVAVGGCNVLGGGPSADDAAGRLAKALSSGHLGTVRFQGGTSTAQHDFTDLVGGLAAAPRTVKVDSVTTQGSTATARLSYTWRLAGASKPWTYRTTARFHRTSSAWTPVWGPTLVHPQLRRGGHLTLSHQFGGRADILGAHGVHLVTDRPVVRFGIDKAKLPASREQSTARGLAQTLDVDATSYAKRVEAAGPKAFVEALVLRVADARPLLARGVGDRPGVDVIRGEMPLGPTREFARALLGTVGPVSAEIVKASKGVYSAGDEAGLSGLEARYDEQLRGTPGVTVAAVAGGGSSRTLFHTDPVPGKPLRTTLDLHLQSLAEQALSGVGPASSLVAVRPSTGALLAAANGPGSKGYPTATLGRYAPGSTFKVVSSLALLRSGLGPASTMSCPPTTTVSGKRFKNYSDYPPSGIGRISLSTAVANSCNTAFVNERDAVSQADIADAAAALGLGVDHDTGFPSFFGSVPASENQAGGTTGHAASMIGQGRVLASPMAMAAVAASVRAGHRVVPSLLPQVRTDGGHVEKPSHPLTGHEAAQLRGLMRGVVTRGSGVFLASVPGPPVLAKTGTAEFGDTPPLKTHAWMIAVHGDLAVAVFVDVGESGSGTAGPILDRFLRGAG